MREIKFRAWDKYSKSWLLGYELKNLGGFNMFGECVVMGEWGGLAWEHVQGKRDIELMQYTGLKDRHGVEIYEGDILATEQPLNLPDIDTWAREVMGQVRWSDRWHQWDGMPDDDDDSIYSVQFVSVIGNIYENPELLMEVVDGR